MPLVGHPSFPQPQNPSVPLWRYMDTPKLLWLLLHREIYLRRVDLLPDKFEGTAPKLAREVVQHGIATTGNLPPLKVAQMADQWGKFGREMRRTNYASCWCLQEHESEAMWRIYCGDDQGVAIVLPYSQLKSSLHSENTFIGTLTYIDYERQLFELGNNFNFVMHKRREFAYESEVRVVNWRMPRKPIQEWIEADVPPSVTLPWDPENLAQIVVSPYAPNWYLETIRETVGRIAPQLAQRVVASSMTAGPY